MAAASSSSAATMGTPYGSAGGGGGGGSVPVIRQGGGSPAASSEQESARTGTGVSVGRQRTIVSSVIRDEIKFMGSSIRLFLSAFPPSFSPCFRLVHRRTL